MRVAADPAHLEAIANDPAIRPYLGGDGEVRAGDSWANTIGLEWDSGGVVFVQEAMGIYSGHLVFARKTQDTLAKVQEAFRHMFCTVKAREIRADFPSHFAHVRRIVRALGMRHISDNNGSAHYAQTAREWTKHKE